MSSTVKKNSGGYLVSTKRKSNSTGKKSSVVVKKEQENSLHSTSANLPLFTSIDNFYLTDFVCENSAIMAKVSKTSRANKRLKKISIYN